MRVFMRDLFSQQEMGSRFMNTPVQTKQELLSRLQEQSTQLRSLGVKRLGLFGSFVREQQNVDSDIDFLVEFDPGEKTFEHFMQLAFFEVEYAALTSRTTNGKSRSTIPTQAGYTRDVTNMAISQGSHPHQDRPDLYQAF